MRTIGRVHTYCTSFAAAECHGMEMDLEHRTEIHTLNISIPFQICSGLPRLVEAIEKATSDSDDKDSIMCLDRSQCEIRHTVS